MDVVGGGGWLAPVNPQNRYAFETDRDSCSMPIIQYFGTFSKKKEKAGLSVPIHFQIVSILGFERYL